MLEHTGKTGIKAGIWERHAASLAGARTHRQVQLVPAKNNKPTTSPEDKEILADAGGQSSSEAPTERSPESVSRINVKEIAERVYRLMQHDLIVERDRTTRLGV